MTKPILIVGGGPAGLSAAHAVAASGRKAVLVEKEDRLGGAPILSGYAKLVPSHEWAKDAIGGMVTRVTGIAGVDVRLNSVVRTFDGSPLNIFGAVTQMKQLPRDVAALAQIEVAPGVFAGPTFTYFS